jgi:hypothetical protein
MKKLILGLKPHDLPLALPGPCATVRRRCPRVAEALAEAQASKAKSARGKGWTIVTVWK